MDTAEGGWRAWSFRSTCRASRRQMRCATARSTSVDKLTSQFRERQPDQVELWGKWATQHEWHRSSPHPRRGKSRMNFSWRVFFLLFSLAQKKISFLSHSNTIRTRSDLYAVRPVKAKHRLPAGSTAYTFSPQNTLLASSSKMFSYVQRAKVIALRDLEPQQATLSSLRLQEVTIGALFRLSRHATLG